MDFKGVYMKGIKYFLAIIIFSMVYSCSDMLVTSPESNMNVRDIEAAWQRINSVYPFLKLKKINWDSLHTIYISRAENARGDEIYLVLRDMLYELKDGHVYYKTEGGGEVYPYYPARYFKDRYSYSPFVVRKYFDRELKLTDSKKVEYEIFQNNIGYIFLSDFGKDYLIKEFPAVMEYVKNTKGLIIDIRQKKGGLYENVHAVVSRFITTSLPKPKFYFLNKLVEQTPFQPISSSLIYRNPVVVLINGSTFSAGELTTEILKQLPNVTAVGDTTGGGGAASSDNAPETAGEYKLPSGKTICVGSGYVERYDGKTYEWIGVPPDVRIEQTEADILMGRDRQLEYAINLHK